MTGDGLCLGCSISYAKCNPEIHGGLAFRMLASGISSCLTHSVRACDVETWPPSH